MTLCTDCNTEINNRPMYEGVPGGDWISSCEICEWYSEDDEPATRIKQGLTLEELVAHKKELNEIRDMIFNVWKRKQPQELTNIMDALDSARRELLLEDEVNWSKPLGDELHPPYDYDIHNKEE